MIEGKPRTYTRECECGARVTVASTIGPSNICGDCAGTLLAFIFSVPGAEFPPGYRFPLDEVPLDDEGNPVSCGNRQDVPKAERRHAWVYLGTDTRHIEDVFEDLHVYACAVCGQDRQTRTPPAP